MATLLLPDGVVRDPGCYEHIAVPSGILLNR
jgi:hypothetical protein